MIFQTLRLLMFFLVALAFQASGNDVITIATGDKDGMYHRLGLLLKQQLEKTPNVEVKVIATQGSGENVELLAGKKVDFAIAQTGVTDFSQLQVVTPLFAEPVLVLAPQHMNIDGIGQLTPNLLDLGAEGSGSRVSAERILTHYDIAIANEQKDASVKIVVTAMLNPSIKRMVREQKLRLLAIEDAQAIAIKHPHLQAITVPRGMFSANPPVPSMATQTVAATAVLLARADTTPEVTELMLNGIYRSKLKSSFPLLMTPNEVKAWSLFPYKPLSINYLDPYSGLGLYANFAESLVAVKELIFFVIGIAYFAWLQFKRWRQRIEQRQLSELKEQLDVFLEKTVSLERLYMCERDTHQLQLLLQQVIDNKLTALEQLTNEQLRGDNLFAIFIAQSNSLVARIEHKIDSEHQV